MKGYFTTHDIALMLDVTRVTVRNWIVKGRLEATTTPGGHRRVDREELVRFLRVNNHDPDVIRKYELTRQSRFVPCWEFHMEGFSESSIHHQCDNCLVKLCRAEKCHVLKESEGHRKVFCKISCQDCEYFDKFFG